jgi:hypothetical protein
MVLELRIAAQEHAFSARMDLGRIMARVLGTKVRSDIHFDHSDP